MKKVEAYYEGESYNQSAWVLEKNRKVLREICYLLDNVEKEKLEQHESLLIALEECLKLYLFWCGKRELYCTEVISFLQENGLKGLEHLKYVSGDTSQKDLLTQQEEENKVIKNIFGLITPNNNRTEIHVKLALLTIKSEWRKRIEDNIELVTNGEQSWEWFYEQHKNDSLTGAMIEVPTLLHLKKQGEPPCQNH